MRNVALAASALLVLVLATQALWLAPLVVRYLADRSGREVRIEAMWIGLSTSLAPVLHVRGIHIANAPWADSDRPFAALGSATAVFSWRSIEQRRPVVAVWKLADGEIDLERRADGLRNWRLANPEHRGPGRWKVLAVQGERATVRFLHGGVDLDLRATASAAAAPAAAGSAPRPIHLDLRGRWRELPFAISADTGPVLTFLETGESFPVRGQLEAGGARIELDGAAGDILREPSVDARVSIAAPSLAPFAAFVASRHREARAIQVEGALKIGAERYALSSAKARVGATDVAGEASWNRADGRSVVHATLESDSTDVADLRWLAGLSRVPVHGSAAVAASSPTAASGVPLGRREASGLEAELSYGARKLRAAELPALQSGRVEAKLGDGRLTVSRFAIGLAQGHVDGRASIVVHESPMRAEAEVDARGVRVEQFVRDAAGRSRITGALQGHASLKASGDAAESLRDSVSGRITASLTGGTLSSLLDAEIGLQGGKIVKSLIGGAEPIAIRCARAALDLDRGTGRLRSLVLDTERTRTTGTGLMDLGAGTVDVVLTPVAKQDGLFNLERSIRLHGPLRHPERSLVARAPAAVAADRGCERP